MHKLTLILLTFVLFGCASKESGENRDKQLSAIEKYVSQEPYTLQGGVYVIVTQIGEVGALTPEYGDLITFNYVEREFVDKPGGIITTNRPDVAEEAKLGIPKELLVPMEIEWGVTPIILGLKGALMWATKGESLLAIMPFELGYGDEWNNIIPPYTALAFEIDILDIQKKNEK